MDVNTWTIMKPKLSYWVDVNTWIIMKPKLSYWVNVNTWMIMKPKLSYRVNVNTWMIKKPKLSYWVNVNTWIIAEKICSKLLPAILPQHIFAPKDNSNVISHFFSKYILYIPFDTYRAIWQI